MAERAKGRAKAAKGKIPSRGRVATLPKQSKGKRGIGDNSGHTVPDEVIARHHDAMNSKWKGVERAKESYDQAKGVYQSSRKAAKKEGVNLTAYDINRALEKQDLGIVQIDHADAARYQKIMGSPLVQLGLFDSVVVPPPAVDAFLQGEQAGKNAESTDNNPFQAGTDNFVKWSEGWAKGQKSVLDNAMSSLSH